MGAAVGAKVGLSLRVGCDDDHQGAHLVRPPDDLDPLVVTVHDDAGITVRLLPDQCTVGLHGRLAQVLLHLLAKLVRGAVEAPLDREELTCALGRRNRFHGLEPHCRSTVAASSCAHLHPPRPSGAGWDRLTYRQCRHCPLRQLHIAKLTDATDLDPLSAVQLCLPTQPLHLHLALAAEGKTHHADWRQRSVLRRPQGQWRDSVGQGHPDI
mmetsp:Transcript_42889/g.124014  ORF Transcript_42889/g.124014 Transcript_42889/m.124014 type:complete len:211 (-) Transcript_42889:800-1432(-)